MLVSVMDADLKTLEVTLLCDKNDTIAVKDVATFHALATRVSTATAVDTHHDDHRPSILVAEFNRTKPDSKILTSLTFPDF